MTLSVMRPHMISLLAFSVAALRAALAAHKDIEVIRGLCEGGKVPEEVRTDLWKVGYDRCLALIVVYQFD